MANPQAEHGHVDIANEIMEALAKISIPSEARRILDFILRKTYGWHKKEDAIPLSQFVSGTGLSRSHVCRAIKRLHEMNLIYKDSPQVGTAQSPGWDCQITTYGFQKNFDKWIGSPNGGTGSQSSPQGGTPPSPKAGNKAVPARGHSKEKQKKKRTKENILRDPQIKIFIDFYHEEFKRQFGTPPIIQGGKDGSIVKSLLKSIPIEELKALLLSLFNSSDPFIMKSGYTLGVFKSQINKLRIGTNRQPGLKSWADEIMEEENGREGQKAIPDPNGDARNGVQGADPKRKSKTVF